MQGARVEPGVTALYVSSKLDPHYLVRTEAAEALDILLVCRRQCFADLFGKGGEELIKSLKAAKYKPGTENCLLVYTQCCAHGSTAPGPLASPRLTPPALPEPKHVEQPAPTLLLLEPAIQPGAR